MYSALSDRETKKESLLNFINDLLMKIGEEEIMILSGNAPCHSDPPNSYFPNHAIKTLPNYSPFLNMTELANAALKAAMKSHLSQPSTIAQF